ncbi:DUF1993 domain-containing protein [SAR86 cluster bacterium]|jgi:hypothetical protein|nr:DUF1993 domain-containing protein [SAR86 cluster bacterium]
MSIKINQASLETYKQILPAALQILNKAKLHFEETGTDLEDIVQARLYEDMAPFSFQVFSIVHHSVGALNALKSGEFGPPNMPENLDFAALHSLLEEAVNDLKNFTADEVDACSEQEVLFKMGSIEWPFSSESFILSFSLPNFYFHVTTMYDMLRMRGVSVGKLDFIGKMQLKN